MSCWPSSARARPSSSRPEVCPPNIEELLSGFRDRVQTLTPMERTVLQYYIDGCSLEEVAARAYISVATAKKHNTNINRKLGVTSREELMLYIDLFRRCARLDEIAAAAGRGYCKVHNLTVVRLCHLVYYSVVFCGFGGVFAPQT